MAGDNTIATLGAWDFNERLIGEMRSRKFASAKTFLVAAGPVKFQDVTAENVSPLGLIQQVGMQQQRQLFRLFEVGSMENYLVAGRHNNRLTLSRLMYHGDSLLKAISKNNGRDFPADIPGHSRPGFDANSVLWWNLQSVQFEEPVGLYLRLDSFEDADNVMGDGSLGDSATIGGVYLEECMIDTHQVNVDANQVIVAENVGLQWSQLVPME